MKTAQEILSENDEFIKNTKTQAEILILMEELRNSPQLKKTLLQLEEVIKESQS